MIVAVCYKANMEAVPSPWNGLFFVYSYPLGGCNFIAFTEALLDEFNARRRSPGRPRKEVKL